MESFASKVDSRAALAHRCADILAELFMPEGPSEAGCIRMLHGRDSLIEDTPTISDARELRQIGCLSFSIALIPHITPMSGSS